jgi:hypothetical protein
MYSYFHFLMFHLAIIAFFFLVSASAMALTSAGSNESTKMSEKFKTQASKDEIQLYVRLSKAADQGDVAAQCETRPEVL